MSSPHSIVSSAHLVSERSAELSEFEYGLIVANNAFSRWVVQCMAAAGVPDLSVTEILVLHCVNSRAREKRLADIAFVLHIEDTHIVNYALKKLDRHGLIERTRRGKEVLYSTSEKGQETVRRYREVRESCLIRAMDALGTVDNRQIGEAAGLLRALSGLYDQASRAASSL
ncbi:winged helix DNA-binding protein [Arenibaculum pallidiluteum]|uniref:winged helix DNA-binding protein n=1 Tax=Arenibaculum pallidiluteum TaxID=2812559 RepID=UPI001A96BAED|nr:winged helix DNA-binding protein [Arenibaculum pallidiluteum]